MVLLNKLKNSIFKCYRFINLIASNSLCAPIIETFYTDFWNYRNYLIKANKGRTELYNAYLERSCASIGLKSIFKSTPLLSKEIFSDMI